MTLFVLIAVCVVAYCFTMFFIPAWRKWALWIGLAVLLVPGLVFAKRQFGTKVPGSWMEAGDYQSYVLVRMRMVPAPQIEKCGLALVGSTFSSPDMVGPMVRTYRLLELNEAKIPGIVLFGDGNKTRIRVDDGDAWEIEMLPGNPLRGLVPHE